MNLNFNTAVASAYKSPAQIARVLTENWMSHNMFCPICGNERIGQYDNNMPVADFYCERCCSDYELKSKNGNLTNTITDGAYDTMIERITGNQNPHLFYMGYSKLSMRVEKLILVPKYFFVPDIIQKRNPLKPTAKRAGWVGCNILIGNVPAQGKIHIIDNGIVQTKDAIVAKARKTQALETRDINSRGWLLDTLMCVNKISLSEFSLSDMYLFESELAAKHPDNNNVQPKIRQQLQVLRDKGYIEFLGRGRYRKIL